MYIITSVIYLRQGFKKAWSRMLVLLQVVLKFMYFPPWSRCRNGKEKSSVWFVRTYLNIVCSYTKHVTLLHWAMKLEKFVFSIWIDTSILLKSHSGISVRFTRSCSQNPSLMLLELVIMAATSIQIQSNTNHKFIHKNFICIFNAIIMNLSHS